LPNGSRNKFRMTRKGEGELS